MKEAASLYQKDTLRTYLCSGQLGIQLHQAAQSSVLLQLVLLGSIAGKLGYIGTRLQDEMSAC